jgi:hypothetical protein
MNNLVHKTSAEQLLEIVRMANTVADKFSLHPKDVISAMLDGITKPEPEKRIFVFGSNLAGRHVGGAARYAYFDHAAEMGVGEGLTGNSYALTTVGEDFCAMSLEDVRDRVTLFLGIARFLGDREFQVTRIGCGIAGFKDSEIAPMFADAPSNCLFDEAWKPFLPSSFRFWGTF